VSRNYEVRCPLNYVSDTEDAYSQINWTATGQTDLTITITDRVVTIEAADNWYGTETITFIAQDSECLTSSDTAIFTVTSVNDAPVISDIGDQTIDEDFSFTSITLDQFISDIEDSDSQITWTVTGNSELAITMTNRIATIKAPANWSGTETITFIAEDTGGLTASDSAIFTVNSVNDAPVISGILDQTVNEDTSFTAINLDDCVVDIEDAADIDGDGDNDIVATSDKEVAWFENEGFNSFTKHTLFESTGYDDDLYAVYTADLDGDEDIDILYGNDRDNDVIWLENDGSENFTEMALVHLKVMQMHWFTGWILFL
jgi:hypothetical protein